MAQLLDPVGWVEVEIEVEVEVEIEVEVEARRTGRYENLLNHMIHDCLPLH